MIAVLRLALADLRTQRALVIGAVLLVAAPIAGFLLLDGYTRAVDGAFRETASNELIVQAANSVGEFAGSRIPANVEQELLDLGVGFAVPEIHTVTGTATNNATLLRGVDPTRYASVAPHTMVAGTPLGPDAGLRDVMIGIDLAADNGVVIGDQIDIRGRPFDIVGVFEVGTYADNEAWLTIEAAQTLLGWGDEVSVFVVPVDGVLEEGDVLAGPLSVARRGDFVSIAAEWDPVIDLLRLSSLALGVAGSLILGTILWRFAWLRRRELAILRVLGMGKRSVPAFLVSQGAVIAGVGGLLGLAAALGLAPVIEVRAFGIVAAPEYDAVGIVRGGGVGVLILVAALAVSVGRIRQASPAVLLRRE